MRWICLEETFFDEVSAHLRRRTDWSVRLESVGMLSTFFGMDGPAKLLETVGREAALFRRLPVAVGSAVGSARCFFLLAVDPFVDSSNKLKRRFVVALTATLGGTSFRNDSLELFAFSGTGTFIRPECLVWW